MVYPFESDASRLYYDIVVEWFKALVRKTDFIVGSNPTDVFAFKLYEAD